MEDDTLVAFDDEQFFMDLPNTDSLKTPLVEPEE